MQNKLYTIQFFSPLNYQPTVSPRAAIAEPRNHEFSKIPEKVQTPRQETVQTHGIKKEKFLLPRQPPFIN